MSLPQIKFTPVLLFTIVGLLISSCGNNSSQQSAPDIDDLLSFEAKLIHSFDHTGDRYFDHLGYESIVLENGNIVFGDRELSNIIAVNNEGELQKVVEEGRGPGEVLDAYIFSKDNNGNIYVHDQDNDKIILFDENLELVQELIPTNYESTSITKVYPTGTENELLLELTSFEFMRDENTDREIILVKYNSETETYGEEFSFRAQPYARLILDGQVRGAAKVPYAPGNIIAHNSADETLFVFDTGTDIIAEINAQFDTLNTIPVNLPTEEISSAERDSMKASYSFSEQWKTVQEILPDVKAPADKMMYYNGEFWLKSNIERDTEMWMVVNMDGQITRIVHLPKESMLMHVSDEHLGVRLDDVTFALFTNPKPEGL